MDENDPHAITTNHRPVYVSFTAEEALVLCEARSRTFDDSDDDLTFTLEYQAELVVMLRLHGALQKGVVAPVRSDCFAILETARKIVQGSYDNRTGEDYTGDEVLPTR